MKSQWIQPNRRGYLLIEVLVSVLVLALCVMAASGMFSSSLRSVVMHRQVNRAGQLASTIFEQYRGRSISNYYAMAGLDHASPTPAAAYFDGEDPKYKNALVTSQSAYSSDMSSCTVQVSVFWPNQPAPKVFAKTFFERPVTEGGGTVRVWARVPCGTGLTDDQLKACPEAIAGVKIVAPSAGSGQDPEALTDSQGAAVLKGVKLGSNVVLSISAPGGSKYNNSLADSWATSYYGLDGTGTPYTTVSKTVSVGSTEDTVVIVGSFVPARQLVGTLADAASGVAVEGATVTLSANLYLYDGSQYRRCGADLVCSEISDGQGRFGFLNVIPHDVSLSVKTYRGSWPTIPPSDAANFHQGYMPPADQSVSKADLDAVRIKSVNIPLVRLGSVVFKTVDQAGQPLPSATVQVYPGDDPADLWFASGEVYTQTDPLTAMATFYNFINSNSQGFTVWAGKAPSPTDPTDNGAYAKFWFSCPGSCVGATTSWPPVTLQRGYLLTLQIQDLAYGDLTRVKDMKVSMIADSPNYISATADSAGVVNLRGFNPYIFDVSGGDPNLRTVWFNMSNAALVNHAQITATVLDDYARTPAPFAYVNYEDMTGWKSIQADASGNALINASLTFNTEWVTGIRCTPGAPYTCAPDGGALQVDTAYQFLYTDGPGPGWTWNHFKISFHNNVPLNAQIDAALMGDQKVDVFMKDRSSGAGLSGATLADTLNPWMSPPPTADASGHAVFWAKISGRTPSSPGQVVLSALDQNINGLHYTPAKTGPVPYDITNPPSAFQPLPVTIEFDPSQGTGL